LLSTCKSPTAPSVNDLLFSADSLSLWTQSTGINLNLSKTVGFYTDTAINMEMIFTANSNMHNTNDVGYASFNQSALSCKEMNGNLDTLYYYNAYTFNSINIYINQTTENGWKYIQLKNIKVYKTR